MLRDCDAYESGPHFGTKRRVLSHRVPSQSGRGLPHSATVRSPSTGGFPPVGDPPRSLGGYGDERDSVLECASSLALSTREPCCGTKRRIFSHRVPSQSGRGLPHSATVRSPSTGGFPPVGDPPRSLGGYGDERRIATPANARPKASVLALLSTKNVLVEIRQGLDQWG